MADDSFTLEGRTYFQQRRRSSEADREGSTHTQNQHSTRWFARDVVTEEQHYIGEQLPLQIQAAKVNRDMLLPHIAATRMRLKEMEKALGRLDRGDPLTRKDRVFIAACGFGAALVGGCAPEVYTEGQQLALDILRGADLAESKPTGADLRGADLSGAKLSGTKLNHADLCHAKLRGSDFTRANLSEARLIGADLSGANLSEAKLSGANLRGANLENANLTRIDLRWADLGESNLTRAELREADLSGVDLAEANLIQANLVRAVLRVASFRRTNLYQADLTDACLRGADLSRADFSKANLSCADLREAILSKTNLKGAIVSREQLAKAQFLKDVVLFDGCRFTESDT